MKQKLIVLMAIIMAAVTSAWGHVDKDVLQRGDIYYKLYADGHAEVIFNSSYYFRESLVIAGTVTYDENNNSIVDENETYNVTEIGEEAFKEGYHKLASVSIPAQVKKVGKGAFHGCSLLATVNIEEGSNLKEIGEDAFRTCYALETLNLPEGVTSIGATAFSGDYGLKSLPIPTTVTSIGESAFYNCSGLTSLNIPVGLTTIGKGAFRYCSKLESLTIPDGVTTIEDNLFDGCSMLTSLVLPNAATNIGQYAFQSCTSLTQLSIPSTVNSIGKYAFSNCTQLTSLTIPEGVTSIDEGTFWGCSRLTSLKIPEGVTSIGQKTFMNCTSLGSITIPDGVSSIGESAFEGCSSLVSAGIPKDEDYTEVSKNLFKGCSSLKEVMIPSTITSLGVSSFDGCIGLEKMYITTANPPTLKTDALSSVSNVVVYVSAGVIDKFKNDWYSYIQWNNFTFEPLPTIRYYATGDNDVKPAVSSGFGTNVQVVGYGLTNKETEGERRVGYFVFMGEPTAIPDGAFEGCTELAGIEIPNGVTKIGANAFKGCSGLSSILFFNKEKPEIGASAFDGTPSGTVYMREVARSGFGTGDTWEGKTICQFSNIRYTSDGGVDVTPKANVDFGNGVKFLGSFYDGEVDGASCGYLEFKGTVTTVPAEAFKDNADLTSVVLPSTVTSIGNSAFQNNTKLAKINLPSDLTTMGEYAFNGCTSLTGIHIPAGVTELEYKIFEGCTALANVTFESKYNMQTIDQYAFNGCSALTSIQLPLSTSRLGTHAFSCTGLKEFTVPVNAYVNSYILDGSNKLETLYWLTNRFPSDHPLYGTPTTMKIYARSSLNMGNFDSWVADGRPFEKSLVDVRYTSEDEKIVYANAETGFGENVVYLGSDYQGEERINNIPYKYGSLVFNGNPTAIPDEAFSGKSNLTSINLPESLTAIGDNAFAGTALKNVKVPENVTSLGNSLFENCGDLKYVLLLASTAAETVSKSTFTNSANEDMKVYVHFGALQSYKDASNWTGIPVDPLPYIKYTSKTNTEYVPHNFSKQHFPKDVEFLGCYIDGTKNSNGDYICYLEFMGVMTEVPGFLFYDDNKKIPTSVFIPALFEKVGQETFKSCYNLASVTFEEGSRMKEIGDEAFSGCSGLTSIKLPNSVTTIGYQAFYNNLHNTKIHIPSSVTSIGDAAFRVSSNAQYDYVTEVTYDGTLEQWCAIDFVNGGSNPMCRFSGKGTVTSSDSNKKPLFGTTQTIPETVTEIKPYTFYKANITELNLGNVTKVGKGSFENTALVSLTINDELTEIGEYAFNNTSITTLDLNHVSKIGKDAFQGCSSLTSLTLSDELTEISEYAFYNSKIASLDLKNVTKIGTRAFYNCTKLATLTLNKELETMGEKAFEDAKITTLNYNIENAETLTNKPYDASKLTTVNIGDEVKTIPEGAFASSLITSIDIPESVTAIGDGAFSGCTALAAVNVAQKDPKDITLGTAVFEDVNKETCQLTVPRRSSAYRTAAQWSDFQNIEDFLAVLEDGVDYTDAVGKTDWEIDYKRTFKNDSWQALFVPFAMTYDDWKDHGKVAELVSVDDDGTLVWEYLGEGDETVAGTPYIFKPNKFEEGQTLETVTFSVSHADLVSNGKIEDVKPNYTETETESGYTLSGTYAVKSEMNDLYALSAGNFYKDATGTKSLNPYRIFLSVPATLSQSNAPVRSRINGEDVTAIEGIEAEIIPHGNAYNLHGVRVDNSYKGIVIVNGKKVLRK